MLYSIKLYISIKTSTSYALSTWVLFILNGVQFLNTTYLYLSPASLAVCLVAVFPSPSAPVIVTVPLRRIYVSP